MEDEKTILPDTATANTLSQKYNTVQAPKFKNTISSQAVDPTKAFNKVTPSFWYAYGEEEEPAANSPKSTIVYSNSFSFPPSPQIHPTTSSENKK
uniref:Uncharacterized protein n=1 Tax=Cucumis sativus TaxID=3659 RepID=A0A0A0K539_CUCSA